MSYRKICRCCGLTLMHSCGGNPNICRDCEALTFDNSPMDVAQQMIMELGEAEPIEPPFKTAPDFAQFR